MKIAVLSDTHDRLPGHVLDAIRGASEIWHLGDVTTDSILASIRALRVPLRVVRGNCDSCEEWPLFLQFECEGFRIHLVHIPPKMPPANVDMLFCGHTHVPMDQVIRGVRFLNPGCITRPNRGAPASYAWLDLEKGKPARWKLVKV